jgi:2-oxoglutarate ferredoxin oxidoreductase subunit beta
MTYIAKPKLHHPGLPKNDLGFTRRDYEGKVSTLCAGCGHDSISAAIIQACFELDRAAPRRQAVRHRLLVEDADYFLGNSHGFNTVHGRMPSVLTGANLANRDLIYLGVSGDGDSASIGLGQFAHSRAARRQHDLYRREQRRVRPDQGPVLGHRRPGSKSKRGVVNTDKAIDLVGDGAAARRHLRRRAASPATRRSWCR